MSQINWPAALVSLSQYIEQEQPIGHHSVGEEEDLPSHLAMNLSSKIRLKYFLILVIKVVIADMR